MLHNHLQYKSINDNDNNRDWINNNKKSRHMFVFCIYLQSDGSMNLTLIP